MSAWTVEIHGKLLAPGQATAKRRLERLLVLLAEHDFEVQVLSAHPMDRHPPAKLPQSLHMLVGGEVIPCDDDPYRKGTDVSVTLLPRETRTQLRELIVQRLAESEAPSPHDAVAGLVDELPDDQVREVAVAAIGEWAVYVNQAIRRNTLNPTQSRRWSQVAEAVAAQPEIFALRIAVGPGPDDWKMLGDCAASDLAYAEERDRGVGQGLIRRADSYAELQRRLRSSRKATVSDLGEQTVRRIFDA